MMCSYTVSCHMVQLLVSKHHRHYILCWTLSFSRDTIFPEEPIDFWQEAARQSIDIDV